MDYSQFNNYRNDMLHHLKKVGVVYNKIPSTKRLVFDTGKAVLKIPELQEINFSDFDKDNLIVTTAVSVGGALLSGVGKLVGNKKKKEQEKEIKKQNEVNLRVQEKNQALNYYGEKVNSLVKNENDLSSTKLFSYIGIGVISIICIIIILK